MLRVLIATKNPGKLAEFTALLQSLPAAWVTPDTAGVTVDVRETGQTYAENARLKAEAWSRATGLIALGDDSGLEVEALGGRPGLRSARYAGPGAADADRRHKLMQELSQAPTPRPARFVCVVAVAHPALGVRAFEGVCSGEVILEERGSNGFGYDPIFYLPEYQATMAELPPAIKNSISHRARAIQAALPYLKGLLTGQTSSVPPSSVLRPPSTDG
jgi:XTP/dITP diphosphohydrolase